MAKKLNDSDSFFFSLTLFEYHISVLLRWCARRRKRRRLLRTHKGYEPNAERGAAGKDPPGAVSGGALAVLGQGQVGYARRGQVWELCSGSSALSAEASREQIPHLPPVDLRYGWDLARLRDQTFVLKTLIDTGAETLFAAPNCSPWGAHTRSLPSEVLAMKRDFETPCLAFIAV